MKNFGNRSIGLQRCHREYQCSNFVEGSKLLILHSSQGIGNGMVGETDGYLISLPKGIQWSGLQEHQLPNVQLQWKIQDLAVSVRYGMGKDGGKGWGFVSHPKGKQ